MDILFVTISEKVRLRDEVNGNMILATILLDAGFSADILRFAQFDSWRKNYPLFIREITDRIVEIAPKCVSFYTLCASYHIVLRIACEVRKRNPDIKIIFGGPQATVLARPTMEAMPFIDYICTDEGENTIVPFLHALLRSNGEGLKDVPGLLYRENGTIVKNEKPVPLTELDTVPYWKDSLLLPGEGIGEAGISSPYYHMSIDVGRGCPYNCTYCSTSYFWHRRYRMKSPQRIVQDFLYYNKKYGVRSFDMAHDAFTVNQKLIAEVCDAVLKENLDITWHCTTRIDCVSKELILKMKQAGMYRISFGIESGSPRIQKLINKNLDLSKVKPTIQFLHENGLKVSLYFMYGLPDETPEDLVQTLNLLFEVMDMGVHKVKMHFCLFDPCTEVTVKNYDNLVFDTSMTRVFKSVFGWEEELEMFKENKILFSFYYNLDTPVRRNYQYLTYLIYLYEGNREIMKYIRSLYNGDDLALYRDFYAANQHFLTDISHMDETMLHDQTQMILNLIDVIAPDNAAQLKAWVELKEDVQQVARSEGDIQLQKNYALSFFEFCRKAPFEKLSKAGSTVVIKKENGTVRTVLKDIWDTN